MKIDKQKILSIKEIKKIIIEKKKKKLKIGLCHGAFDLMHLGHLNHFKEAKKSVDVLIVSVTSDNFIYKGPGRPFFDQNQRMETISFVEVVDYVVLSESESALPIINLVKPEIYFKGPDYRDNTKDLTNNIKKENSLVKKNNGHTIYTNSKKYSSTVLINKLKYSHEQENSNIKAIKKKFSFEKIKKIIDQLDLVKPFVIGEVIIDIYVFCEALGKSGKEPTLVLKNIYEEMYLGGSGAICNHLSSFCEKVFLLGNIGNNKEKLSFIKRKLNHKISFDFILKKNSPTIIKKRYIDSITKHKLLGIYSLNDSQIGLNEKKLLLNKFKNTKKKTNLTIIADYGHGLIDQKTAKAIIGNSNFVAVNSQINASNFGHHTLKHYKNIDFMIINESELNHEIRNRDLGLFKSIKILSKNLKVKYLAITRGSSGVVLYNQKKNTFYECPAFVSNPIDKVGSGDAMLAILSICLFKKIDINLSLLIASLAAAQSVNTIGNKTSVSKLKLLKDLMHLLL